MAITSGFFNSVNKDRTYNAAQIGKYLQYIVSSGVFPFVSSSLQVLANDGMTVEVQAGRAMLDCHYMDNDSPITLTLTAGGTQDRIDGIIMYVDMTERACGITVKEGTPAASPKPPAMTRTDVRKEYMLAAVRVNKLSSSITQSSITDTRPDNTVCGWVTGLIDQVDTATLFTQWQTAYEEAYAELGDYLAAQKAAWDAFFTAVAEDNLVPVPNVDAIGKAIVVNATGDGYVLDGPDIIAVGKALEAPNLLDNSNFVYPVNEGGAAVYTGAKETITKWISRSGYSTVTIKEDCVNIKSSNGTTTAYVLQFLEAGKIKSGRKYTVACELKDGSKHCITAEASTSMTEATRYIYVNGVQLGTIRFRYDASEGKYAVMFSTLSTSGIDVVNVALYEGEYDSETLPMYIPRGYSLEAAVCIGGGGLNFKVVGGTTQPTNPTENTIWVNTSVNITSWVFSTTEPAAPKEGMVWISTGTSSPVVFNALKKNSIQVYPLSAKQYISNALVEVTAMSYQNGEWVEWIPEGALYHRGNEMTEKTGGWSGVAWLPNSNYTSDGFTFEKKDKYMSMVFTTASKGRDCSVYSNNKVDMSKYDTLRIEVDTTKSCKFGLSSAKPSASSAPTWVASKLTSESKILDVSGYDGTYYIVVWQYCSNAETCRADIHEIVAE